LATFFAEYGLFLLKVLTFLFAILAVIFTIFMLGGRNRRQGPKGHIESANAVMAPRW